MDLQCCESKIETTENGGEVQAGPNNVSVLGVRVSDINKDGLISRVQAWADQTRLRTVVYVNAYCINTAYIDPRYRNILNHADLTFPDGIGVVWAGRWLGGSQLEKLNGRVWFPEICKIAVKRKWSIYILAGKRGVAACAKNILQNRYPGLQIVGAADGFFEERSDTEVLQEITELRPNILFVGMGAPLQEKWIATHRDAIPVPVVWAVGALFDTVVGIEKLAPDWLNALALEWFWRLLMDPRKKWRRYLIGNPLFIFRVFRQKYFNK
jgi:N-acetylglucosaminyldiphosphoundecaprenol N-acetyl-beta-D-mannosaminyltransferase